jgi:hypothetical protein
MLYVPLSNAGVRAKRVPTWVIGQLQNGPLNRGKPSTSYPPRARLPQPPRDANQVAPGSAHNDETPAHHCAVAGSGCV